MLPPIEVAIACPEREAELWANVDDPAFRVDGRECAFAGPCASVAELREMLARGAADVVLVSATLNAIPFETLRDLVRNRRAVARPSAGVFARIAACSTHKSLSAPKSARARRVCSGVTL